MTKYIRVIMTERVTDVAGVVRWVSIPSTLAEAPTVTEAIGKCDERFDVWVKENVPEGLENSPRRFEIVQAAPWEVAAPPCTIVVDEQHKGCMFNPTAGQTRRENSDDRD